MPVGVAACAPQQPNVEGGFDRSSTLTVAEAVCLVCCLCCWLLEHSVIVCASQPASLSVCMYVSNSMNVANELQKKGISCFVAITSRACCATARVWAARQGGCMCCDSVVVVNVVKVADSCSCSFTVVLVVWVKGRRCWATLFVRFGLFDPKVMGKRQPCGLFCFVSGGWFAANTRSL